MSRKYRRYTLKPKEAKDSIAKASARLNLDVETFFDPRSNVEAAETEFGQILLIDGRPLLFKEGEQVMPTLLFADLLLKLPKVVVDMGAVPHLCNGADVMAPGIVRVEGDFRKGDLVLVVDVKHGKALCLGEIMHDSGVFSGFKKGVVIKNLHYVGDRYWNALKPLIK